MELPPGHGSSPPGPRPVPPPRRSSVDRRQLSPLRREVKGDVGDATNVEQRGFWEAGSDVNGGSVAWKGQRKEGGVTQRVVIVMHSSVAAPAGLEVPREETPHQSQVISPELGKGQEGTRQNVAMSGLCVTTAQEGGSSGIECRDVTDLTQDGGASYQRNFPQDVGVSHDASQREKASLDATSLDRAGHEENSGQVPLLNRDTGNRLSLQEGRAVAQKDTGSPKHGYPIRESHGALCVKSQSQNFESLGMTKQDDQDGLIISAPPHQNNTRQVTIKHESSIALEQDSISQITLQQHSFSGQTQQGTAIGLASLNDVASIVSQQDNKSNTTLQQDSTNHASKETLQLESGSPTTLQHDRAIDSIAKVKIESFVTMQAESISQSHVTVQQSSGLLTKQSAPLSQEAVLQDIVLPITVLSQQDNMPSGDKAQQQSNVIITQDTNMDPNVKKEQNSVMKCNVVQPEDRTAEKDVKVVQDGSSHSVVVSKQVGPIPSLQNRTNNSIKEQSPASSGPSVSSYGTGGAMLSPSRVLDPSSPQRNISSKPPLPTPIRSNLYPGSQVSASEQELSLRQETASLSSYRMKAPAPDTLSYLDSVSLMSGTLESLTILDDASSLGSDSEINGIPYRKTDKYGFLGGTQYSGIGESSISVEIARQRELKWLDMFSHWDKWLSRRFQKVKLRCRKGIPSSLRARAWQLLSGSEELLKKNMGKFEEMERQPGDPKWLDVIEKDLHRQFPFHEMFAARGGHGQQDLYRILKAYTVYRPEEGYCQAQAPVAAVLLMHMPAEQAFWCLVQICDKYLPGYYSAGLEAIQLDGEIYFALLRKVCPMAYRHLKKFKIDPILYMTEWFMCIFSRTLPWASVLRVWDMFFCEGIKIVFRVGLVLLKHTLGSVEKLRSCQGMYETMEKLRSLPQQYMQEEFLLPEVRTGMALFIEMGCV
ncbi:hypothetical protein GDO86_017653 [Hymenochirus boettgeri]|uniref:Rab-GAP TBC domain-containing protein n=1 Tax=Hymenochirus boettgeri TaxID=247094 RepID=A0A8T2IQY0_9PIPI|nr:hypothetical protein GDO86_017653 [Hymenochirus boettgeri]